MKSIKNRKALHEYHILQHFEAGISLTGTEIKSIRAGKVNFKDSYARVLNGECWLINLHISPWDNAAHFNHDPD
ncbi:MAG TPA: SsrA-binding protein, partial [Candidatus Cloacimonadota bacterium]|nr:SsrA-binding protein [Candidatus Cloacimonadota bacterium]